ncbi:hypothetical protein N7516_005482 [Penicillium verrucosum]|uniref:uncharacterized protein n=1 Tax=Penicillium verrucosum TaxID=60171 RepID=UPI00254540AE|nr:uncharacterized protein N7516_005482 [Penicillium verrucosum]KAJ5945314.1 hypothetical protein N7516_005482 [Penicillium verrucosum]
MSSPTNKVEAIRRCVDELRRCLKDQFILIGGASMMLLGSQRPTNDVDILVSRSEDLAALFSLLAADEAFSNENGQLRFKHSGFSPSLDILTVAVQMITFEQAGPHCLTIEEVKIPKPDYSLAMKVKCFYLRQDDENGHKKRESDIFDIRFLCKVMLQKSEFVSDDCANKFKFGHYHLLELRQELGPEATARFIRVGGRKFILPWDQNSEDQREYFCVFAEPGADPLTTELEDE